jgi:hypothetical protein
MKSPRNLFLVLSLVLLTVSALALGQSSFPVRFADALAPEPAAVVEPVAAVAPGALYLPPLAAPPFSCTAARYGWIYNQDVDGSFTFTNQTVCICQNPNNDNPDAGPIWTLLGSSQPCCSSPGC